MEQEGLQWSSVLLYVWLVLNHQVRVVLSSGDLHRCWMTLWLRMCMGILIGVGMISPSLSSLSLGVVAINIDKAGGCCDHLLVVGSVW